MNRTAAKLLLNIIELIRGEEYSKYLKELEYNTSLPNDVMKLLQKNKLSALLDYSVKHNSYYKSKYNGYNVHTDFDCLPILTKEELRDNYENILSDKRQNKLDLVETSGSTGVPLRFYRDRVIFGYTLASLYRAHRWWGIDIGAKEAMLWGVPVTTRGRIKARTKDFILNRFREKEYNITPKTLEAFRKSVVYKKPDYIFGYSSMVYEFALYLKDNNFNLKHLSLKAAICTAEKIHGYQRKLIEEVFGCKVVSEYGSTETGIISYECKYGSNHISDDCVYVEIVDENNMPVKDGESGRVLVTVLNSFSSPIIRYDLGDISSKTIMPCACGLNLSTLGKIEGRTSDVVLGPNGEIFHSIIFYYIMKELTEKIGGVKQFKVYQKKTDELEFHIVSSKDFANEAEIFIKSQIYEKFGERMKLKIIYCNQIERIKSGKFKDFETELDTSALLSQIYNQHK